MRKRKPPLGCSEVGTGEAPGLERRAARTGRGGGGSSERKRGAGRRRRPRGAPTPPWAQRAPPSWALAGRWGWGREVPSPGSHSCKAGCGSQAGALHCWLLFSRSVGSDLCDPVDCKPPGSSLSMKFSRHECWSGLPCPPPGDLPDPGIEPMFPALAGGFFTTEPPRKRPPPTLHRLPHCVKASSASPLGAEDHPAFGVLPRQPPQSGRTQAGLGRSVGRWAGWATSDQ